MRPLIYEVTTLKTVKSKLFGTLEYQATENTGFSGIAPVGFDNEVFVYFGSDTTANDEAVDNAIRFIDDLVNIDLKCREIIENIAKLGEDLTVDEYFEFYKEEVPDVFGVSDISELSTKAMVDKLVLCSVAAHNTDDVQYVVDYTLGYDQLLCINFNHNKEFSHISWES